ncbi:MAG: ATP-binding protein [Oscillospiraceae bacterium]|jgi:anti-sigma regulatory factor (Ser/Thr protein kinase)|nr:ATP-binding protein [Oscillospiraceae bacterium]MBQ5342377.1 ATP-binding protein [Oscillospiraceae bacterium]
MSSILRKDYVVVRDDYAGAGRVSSDVKATLSSIGIPSPILRRIAVACYESEINMLIHAYGGDITLEIGDDNVIHMTFSDPGPGIPDIEKAMTPGWSTASDKAREMGFGAGMGLPNIKRVSDEFDITSSPEGTTIQLSFRVT